MQRSASIPAQLAVARTRMPRRQPAPPRCAAAGGARHGSLVPETLAALAADAEAQEGLRRLREQGQAALTREEAARRRRALPRVASFDKLLEERGVPTLRHGPVTTLQVNLGLLCNQACTHCHVESSPLRVAENMGAAGVDRLLLLLRASPGVRELDITGGAPELNPEFRRLVVGARALGLQVIDRCNLTVLYEPGQADLAAFLAAQRVRIVASLPCYSAVRARYGYRGLFAPADMRALSILHLQANVDKQRGDGVFDRSIAALRELNAVGYATTDPGLQLDLMYNPGGAFLPPAAETLEAAYKRELHDNFGVSFSSLLCLTNMPIKRFADRLHQAGQTDAYMNTLLEAFNPEAARRVMCTQLVSVRWDGALFSCDFNQQLDMPLNGRKTIFDIDTVDELQGNTIATDLHCLGCTAGSGSSCGGKLA